MNSDNEKFELQATDSPNEELLNKYEDLYRVVFNENIPEKYLTWKHYKNPMGKSIIAYAFNNEKKLIAARAFWRCDLIRNGKNIKALQPCDTATHPNYQRKGLFTKLTLLAIDKAKENNYEVLFNFPNNNSKPGYIKLGWKEVARLEYYFKPISYLRFLKRLIFKYSQIKKIPFPNNNFRFGTCSKKENKIFLLNKNVNYLKWRSEDNFYNNYYQYSAGKSYILFKVLQFKKWNSCLIIDLVFEDTKQNIKLFKEFKRELRVSTNIDFIYTFGLFSANMKRYFFRNFFLKKKLNSNLVVFPLSDMTKDITDEKFWNFYPINIDTM